MFKNNKFFPIHLTLLGLYGLENSNTWKDTYLRRVDGKVFIGILCETGNEDSHKKFNNTLRENSRYVSDSKLDNENYREFLFDPGVSEHGVPYADAIKPLVMQLVKENDVQEEFDKNGGLEMLFEKNPNIRLR